MYLLEQQGFGTQATPAFGTSGIGGMNGGGMNTQFGGFGAKPATSGFGSPSQFTLGGQAATTGTSSNSF